LVAYLLSLNQGYNYPIESSINTVKPAAKEGEATVPNPHGAAEKAPPAPTPRRRAPTNEHANHDPRLDQAAVTDDSLLAAHEKLLGKQPDERAHYSLAPLVLLFVFSGLIFWAGTYLNRYSGHFDAEIFNENAKPTKGQVIVAQEDPMVTGKKVYDQICVTCHQPTGQGLPGTYPPLAGSEWVMGSDERLISIVLYGLKGPVKVKDTMFSAAAMAAGWQSRETQVSTKVMNGSPRF